MQELIDQLVQQLGVTDGQAKGGAGLLLKMAKEKLGKDFSGVAKAIGNVDDLMKAAPEAGGVGKLLGGLTSAMGGDAGDVVGKLASLAGGFKSLDLDADMVSKFLSVLIDFVKSNGGAGAASLLQKALA